MYNSATHPSSRPNPSIHPPDGKWQTTGQYGNQQITEGRRLLTCRLRCGSPSAQSKPNQPCLETTSLERWSTNPCTPRDMAASCHETLHAMRRFGSHASCADGSTTQPATASMPQHGPRRPQALSARIFGDPHGQGESSSTWISTSGLGGWRVDKMVRVLPEPWPCPLRRARGGQLPVKNVEGWGNLLCCASSDTT